MALCANLDLALQLLTVIWRDRMDIIDLSRDQTRKLAEQLDAYD